MAGCLLYLWVTNGGRVVSYEKKGIIYKVAGCIQYLTLYPFEMHATAVHPAHEIQVGTAAGC